MKLLHFADLHLDAPFAWAGPRTSERRRANRRETLRRILALAEEQRVDAILSGGDLYEHDLVSPDTIEFLRRTFDCGIPVLLAPGNHDWYGPTSPYARVRWSPNVHVFTEDRLVPFELDAGVRLWGLAHRGPVTLEDPFGDFHVDGSALHLTLAHASERAALAWQEEGKQAHAPFEAGELALAGIDLALLGHYHAPRRGERFAYPGNPDPLTFGEEGERGALLVTLRDGTPPELETRPVGVSEVHDLVVDVDGAQDRDEIGALVRERLEGVSGSVRITLEGELGGGAQIDWRELAALGPDLDGLQVRPGNLTVAYDLDAIAAQPTVMGAFVRDAQETIEDEDLRRRVILTGLRALHGRDDLDVG